MINLIDNAGKWSPADVARSVRGGALLRVDLPAAAPPAPIAREDTAVL